MRSNLTISILESKLPHEDVDLSSNPVDLNVNTWTQFFSMESSNQFV